MLRSSPNPTAGPAPRTGPPTARASARSPRGTATRSPAWRDGLLALGLAPRVDLEGGLVLSAARAQRARRDQRLLHRQLGHAAAALVAAAAAALALAGGDGGERAADHARVLLPRRQPHALADLEDGAVLAVPLLLRRLEQLRVEEEHGRPLGLLGRRRHVPLLLPRLLDRALGLVGLLDVLLRLGDEGHACLVLGGVRLRRRGELVVLGRHNFTHTPPVSDVT